LDRGQPEQGGAGRDLPLRLAPNKLSDWFGEGAQKFEDNSVTKDYEQSIYDRYLPTRASRI
jgi:hypothetical protein